MYGWWLLGGLAIWSASEWLGGVKLTLQRQDPYVSRVPLRIAVPAVSVMMRVLAVKQAVHPASHSFPMLRRLWVSPGTMWPCWVLGGRSGRVKVAMPVNMSGLPVAMRIVVRGTLALTFVSGAWGRK